VKTHRHIKFGQSHKTLIDALGIVVVEAVLLMGARLVMGAEGDVGQQLEVAAGVVVHVEKLLRCQWML
jgi:hypothetical protein